jgi:phosphatidylinositol glycan class N
MLWIQKMPKMYYAYVFFPIFFWNHICRNYAVLLHALRLSLQNGKVKLFLGLAGTFLCLEALVCFSIYMYV